MQYNNVAIVIIGFAACLALGLWLLFKGDRNHRTFMRGNQLHSDNLDHLVPDAEHPYLFGQQFHSFSELRKSIVLVGSPGSGKTVQILLLMKTVMPRIMEEGSQVRAVVYDSKTDITSKIAAMGVSPDRIKIMNPLDARSYAWDICRDVVSPSEAQDLASALIPLPRGSKQPYFPEAAQRILRGLIEVFQQHCPEHWELRDLILATKTVERLAFLLASTTATEGLLEHFEPANTFSSVRSTLSKELDKLSTAASSWHKSRGEGRALSLSNWLNEQSVIILGNSPKEKAPISVLNNVLLSFLSKQVLSRPGDRPEHNFFFLDEFRELGKIDSMSDLAGLGRSKGSCLVLGFQDIFGVDEVYGKEKSREIIGNCSNIGILHINSTEPDTQKWASEVLGQHEFLETQNSESENFGPQNSHSESKTHMIKSEPVWLPAQFSSDIPKVSLEDGCQGVFRINSQFYQSNIQGKHLFTDEGTYNRVPDEHSDFPNEVPLDPRHTRLTDWDESDFSRLGIAGLKQISALKPQMPDSIRNRLEEVLGKSFLEPDHHSDTEIQRTITGDDLG